MRQRIILLGIFLVFQSFIVRADVPLAGSVAFASDLNLAMEEDGGAQITLTRSGGTSAAVSVKVNSTPGTAAAAAFDVVVNAIVHFDDGQATATIPVTVHPVPNNGPDKFFTLTLSDPQGGVALGSQAMTRVVIVDANDNTSPRLPVLSAPAAGVLHLLPGETITLTGSATDNKGILSVAVGLNSTPALFARLVQNSMGGATFSRPLTLRTGINTVVVQSLDTRGHISPPVTRIFNVFRPLAVGVTGTGSVTAGFSPSSFREVGKKVTVVAKPGAGQVFNGWIVSDTTDTGITPAMQELASLSFTFQEGMTLTASFIPNPFTAAVAGRFNGLVTPDGGTMSSNASVGFFTASVSTTGTFTGTLKMDGSAMPFAGFLDNSGVARFGTARARTLGLLRTGKPALDLAFSLDMSGATGKIRGSVNRRLAAVVSGVSLINADRAAYSTATKAPADLAGTVSKPYTLVFRHHETQGNHDPTQYPQGDGYATGMVKADGTVSFTGKLADNTVVTASVPLSKLNQWPLLAQLYSSQGCIAGMVTADHQAQDTDMACTNAQWFRPPQKTQWYPSGWNDGVFVDIIASQHTPPPASVFPLPLAVDPASGNATLTFANGHLAGPLTKSVNISPTNVASKAPATDTSYAFSLTAINGMFGGTFNHPDGTRPVFQGVLFRKGANQAGYGFFMTVAPKVSDGTGESGGVSLKAR